MTMPTWVVHGEDDTIVFPDQPERLVGALPNAELVMVANAGHQVHREQPEAFLEVLAQAVARVPSAI